MKFDQSLAVKLLKIIDRFPTETFLRPPDSFTKSQLQEIIPEQLDKLPLETILWHLHTLCISDLIQPSIPLDDIRLWAKQYKASDDFLFGEISEILKAQVLTVKGYEYLQNHLQ